MNVERHVSLKQLNYHIVSPNLIETLHLQLRQPTTEDLGVLGNLWRDKKVRQFLGGTISDEEIEAKIVAIQDHWNRYGFGQFAIYNKNTEQIIGICGLHHSEDGIEISYMLFPAYWGFGLATEAVCASLNYGFNFLKLNRIVAITQEANRSSCKLLEKIGMNYTSTLFRFGEVQCVYTLTQPE